MAIGTVAGVPVGIAQLSRFRLVRIVAGVVTLVAGALAIYGHDWIHSAVLVVFFVLVTTASSITTLSKAFEWSKNLYERTWGRNKLLEEHIRSLATGVQVAHFSQVLLRRRPISQKQAQSKSNGHNPRGIEENGMKREQETHPDALKQVRHEDAPIRYL